MSWVELDRIVSEEIVRDDDIRRRLAASGRPLRSHATGMSDDDLLAKLCGLRVDADREKLAGLCDGALSAEEVVSERLRLHDWNADWAWICLTELWQRWWPEKACLELLDDKIQEGYAADQRNDFVASGRIWLGAWSDVLRMCDATGARSIREFDDRFPMTQSLFNWCQDLEMALQNGGEHDPELRTARLEMGAEWLRRFPGEDGLITGNFRRALADSYFETGHQQKADELYQSWLDDDPDWGWGWIGWADCYTPYGPGKTQDYARAEEILRRGYAVTGVREAEHIAGRLADICGRTGRPDEAREFRQQAEKGRRRAGRRVTRVTGRAAPAAGPAGPAAQGARWRDQRVLPGGVADLMKSQVISCAISFGAVHPGTGPERLAPGHYSPASHVPFVAWHPHVVLVGHETGQRSTWAMGRGLRVISPSISIASSGA
jgi:tetratricopeptide (TPR) repeat protein